MNIERFREISARYSGLRLVLAGDFCLDRYLEIDPDQAERSIETGRPVHNVVETRPQPGAAGTILNNLAALGIGRTDCIGFCGKDGEGWELLECLRNVPGICLDGFLQTAERRTFTYTKPILRQPGRPPVELNRLDIKNWTPTPPGISERLAGAFDRSAAQADAVILMDQVDVPETGVITSRFLETVAQLSARQPERILLADSRRTLRHFPPAIYKMNESELARFAGRPQFNSERDLQAEALRISRQTGRLLVVTRAAAGILAAGPDGELQAVPALPVRGELDVVGAGDAVTAQLAAALASGASVRESLELAMLAASVVVHKLGATGTANLTEMEALLASV